MISTARGVRPEPSAEAVTAKDSVGELKLPRAQLLSLRDELHLGSRIRTGLRRLARWLLEHPHGYCLVLGRLQQAAAGEVSVVAWRQHKKRIGKDARAAEHALSLAKERNLTGCESARETYRAGVRILARYEPGPEVLLEWCGRVVSRQDPPRLSAPDSDSCRRLGRLLATLVRRVIEDRDRLASSNARLVLKEALRYRPRGMTSGDLFQEGYLGIQRAALRYDPDRKLRFSTYGTHWVRQAIRYSLLQRSGVIRVPERAQTELRRFETGRESVLDHVDADRLRKILDQTMLCSPTEDGVLDEIRGRCGQSNREAYLETLPAEVAEALSALSARERHILKRRFGFDGEPRMTLERIGESLRMSRERVRQIESQALARLKQDRKLEAVYEELIDEESALSRAGLRTEVFR